MIIKVNILIDIRVLVPGFISNKFIKIYKLILVFFKNPYCVRLTDNNII